MLQLELEVKGENLISAWIMLTFSVSSGIKIYISKVLLIMKSVIAKQIVVFSMLMCILNVKASAQSKVLDSAELSPAGERLLAQYTAQFNILKSQIEKALPKISEEKQAEYLKALQDEKRLEAKLKSVRLNLDEIKKGKALVAHAKGKWIGGADKGIATAKEKLSKAKTLADRELAREELEKWQLNRQEGLDALAKRQAKLDEVKLKEVQWIKELESAREELSGAKAKAIKAAGNLGLNVVLTSDGLDAKLAQFQIFSEASPRGLAAFAQQDDSHEKLIEELFSNVELMIQMAVAGGAKAGKYGQAAKIYSDIQRISSKAKNGVLQRLALGTSLEHAVPVKQRNAKADLNASEMVDPVKRYLHFENAYLNNELDPKFKDLSAWDYRMVVNGEEPEEILAWGRKMLGNYRPDHINTKDYRWRYVAAVRTDIRYGSQDNQYDKNELQFFQNILMNGGVCGRRAFFGRFILRSFGIPTVARPSRGHAALAHWTPDGWVVCLGGAWGVGWARSPESVGPGRISDLIFLAQTQSRMTGKPYEQVWRAKVVASVLSQDNFSELWKGFVQHYQHAIIEESKAETLEAVGSELGEANESRIKYAIEAAILTEEDKMITVGRDGSIIIPAVSCSKPTKSTGKIIFMPSNLGGKQLHYSRTGANTDFQYTFSAQKTGKYALVARVVTPSWKQVLTVNVNATEPVDIALPFTVGMWGETRPIELFLVKGTNTLVFSRDHERLKGVTIRDFTLTPLW